MDNKEIVINDYIGKVVSYPKICSALGCNIKKNKGDKIKQIKTWKEFMEFEEVGCRFKIIDIFDDPFIVDGRVERSKFSKHLKAIILNGYEYQDKKYNLYTDCFKLFEKPNPPTTKEEKIYRQEFDTKMSKIFDAVIKSLQKEKAIYYIQCFYIKETKESKPREAEQFEIDIIEALRKKWLPIVKDNRNTLKKAIDDFNNTFGYYQTWREHYIKVLKHVDCDTQEKVNEFKKEMDKYMKNRMEKLKPPR